MPTRTPPIAEKNPHEIDFRGHVRRDDYFWLRDRDDSKVREYLRAENEYADAMLSHTASLRERLRDEIVGRIPQEDQSVPFRENGYLYYTRFERGKEYPLHCRKRGECAPEEILLDANAMAEGHSVYIVLGTFISPDNTLLAFIVDTSGDRRCTIFFKSLVSGNLLEDVLHNASEKLAWAKDSRTVFYSINDETVRSFKVMRHRIGEPEAEAGEVFHEKDNTFFVQVALSKSKEFIFITSESTLTSEMRYCRSDEPDRDFEIVLPRREGVLYFAEHAHKNFYIRTNEEAQNFKLVEAPIGDTDKEKWNVIAPHREDILLEAFDVFDEYIVLQERKKGLPFFRIVSRHIRENLSVDFEEESYFCYLGENRELDSPLFRFYYTSLVTPLSVYDCDLKTGERRLLKRTDIREYDVSDFETHRVEATAPDGEKIPLSIVFRRGLAKDGKNPLLLYAYGAYGASVNPVFSSEIVSLLARGFVFAVAHVRGGSEMGRRWYEEGKMQKKKNTFTDFIACAKYLVRNGYTSPDRMFANGKSAGGLLMSAVCNMSPDLFSGVIAEVPWVDVVTDMLDSDLPLTTLEYDEWGNPHREEDYEYMFSYSPYDHVERKGYPSILATASFNDTQVTYWNPAKWVAKLREMKTDDNPVLLRTNMGAGHSGASGRFEKYDLITFKYAFMLDRAGIRE